MSANSNNSYKANEHHFYFRVAAQWTGPHKIGLGTNDQSINNGACECTYNSEVTTLRRYTNLFIIILLLFLAHQH